jgi:aryl-alcohol dehydrogenase-like predicted oxidoreductase
MRLSRRVFLKGSAAGLLSTGRLFADERAMPTRELGRTGAKVSLAGLGTADWGRGLPAKTADAIVARALELGVTYVDTAPSYGGGRSEEHLGRALEGRRDRVFLASKTLARDGKGARKELEASLRRLATDRLDLWQFHALASTRDTDQLLREDGALAAGREAQRKGLVRFLGITGHFDPRVFVDALERHPFDTLLIPLNCIDPNHRSFEETALPAAAARGTGVIAMKVYCSGRLVRDGIVKAEECLRYTYGLGIATCIVGCTRVAELELAAAVARNLEAMDEAGRAALRARTKPFSPALEWYKCK